MSLFYFLKTLFEKQLLFILTFFEPFTKWKMKRSESKFCKLSDCLDFFLLRESKKKFQKKNYMTQKIVTFLFEFIIVVFMFLH